MRNELNLKTYFGEDLRDYPENPEDLEKYCEHEELEIQSLTRDEKYKRMSLLAVRYRQLRNFEKAHELFRGASDYFKTPNPLMDMINTLRWPAYSV